LRREASAIYSFSNVTLALLEHEKRRSGVYAVHDLIDDTIRLLKPYLEARETKIELDYSPDNPRIWCATAAFEAIMTNLLTNSLQAFERRQRTNEVSGRRIHIHTRVQDGMAMIRMQDYGPGIDSMSIDDIWIAGKT